jgi:peroxiredoxin
MHKFLIIALLGSLATGLWFTLNKEPVLAPDITLTTLSGKIIDLAELKGHPVIVTFWATDCASCIKEIPDFIDLYQQFHPEGLEIIAITLYYDIPSHVVEMSKNIPLPYDVALDLRSTHAMAFGDVQLSPTTFLISPSGHIVWEKIGLFNAVEMKRKIQQLLKG